MKFTGPTRIKVEIDGYQHIGFFEVHGDLVAVWLPETGGCGKLEGLPPEVRAADLVRELVVGRSSKNALTMLKEDAVKVSGLPGTFETAERRTEKKVLAEHVCPELTIRA